MIQCDGERIWLDYNLFTERGCSLGKTKSRWVLSRPSRTRCVSFLISPASIFHFQMWFIIIGASDSLFLVVSARLVTLIVFLFLVSSHYCLVILYIIFRLIIIGFILGLTSLPFSCRRSWSRSNPSEPQRSSYKQALVQDLGHNGSSFGKDQKADINISPSVQGVRKIV